MQQFKADLPIICILVRNPTYQRCNNSNQHKEKGEPECCPAGLNYFCTVQDEINKNELLKSINKFVDNVNEELKSYNSTIKTEILNAKVGKNEKFKTDQEKVQYAEKYPPNLNKYGFKVDFYYLVHFNTMNNEYYLRDEAGRVKDFDKNHFLNLLQSNALEKIKKLRFGSNPVNKNHEISENRIFDYFGNSNLYDTFYYDFCLKIEYDYMYEHTTIEEALKYCMSSRKVSNEILQAELKITETFDFIINEQNLKNLRKQHFSSLCKALDYITDEVLKNKNFRSLVKDSAYNYKRYLGFTVSFEIDHFDILNSRDFQDISDMYINYTNKNEENMVVFILEIILMYRGEDYNNLIQNEFSKLEKIKNYFKSLYYYDLLKEYYINNFESYKFRDFFLLIFSILNSRIKRLLSVDHDKNEVICLHEYEKTFSEAYWNLMKSKIVKLIELLELNSIEFYDSSKDFLAYFNDFYTLVQQYFTDYKEKTIQKSTNIPKNKVFWIEKSNSNITTRATAYRVSSSSTLQFGVEIVPEYSMMGNILRAIPLVNGIVKWHEVSENKIRFSDLLSFNDTKAHLPNKVKYQGSQSMTKFIEKIKHKIKEFTFNHDVFKTANQTAILYSYYKFLE